MKRITQPRGYESSKKGTNYATIERKALHLNLRVVIEWFKFQSDGIVHITDLSTGIQGKFLYCKETETLNGMTLNSIGHTMLLNYIKQFGIPLVRYKTELVALKRDYPNATDKDRHEICIQLLRKDIATA